MFNKEYRAKQLIDFDEMDCCGASFTDIDFCVEFKNRLWVLGEVKGKGVTLPHGQRLLMERFIEMAREAGRKAIAVVCEHNVRDWHEKILLSDCMIREYYTTETGRWAVPHRPYYVGEMVNAYCRMNGGENSGQSASGVSETG